jgi:hypothetical protein
MLNGNSWSPAKLSMIAFPLTMPQVHEPSDVTKLRWVSDVARTAIHSINLPSVNPIRLDRPETFAQANFQPNCGVALSVHTKARMHAGGDLPSIGVGTLACSIRIRGGSARRSPLKTEVGFAATCWEELRHATRTAEMRRAPYLARRKSGVQRLSTRL